MKKEKKKVHMQFFNSKRGGVILITVLAVLILLINMITATYSWFEPDVIRGTGFKFQQANNIRSEKCSMTVYAQDMNITDRVAYQQSSTQSNINIPQSSKNEPTKGLRYFKIVVLNQDTKNASDISILLNFTVHAGVTVGVVKPTNSVHTYDSDVTNQAFLIRNAYISPKSGTEVDAGRLEVEFFVKYTGDDSNGFSFPTNNFMILYN